MTRKEEIIRAALELASENGLKAVTLSQIAERIGIKKPSLYNHFKSKDELVNGMYSALREHAKQNGNSPPDFSALADKSLEEILLMSLQGYLGFLTDKDMLCFFRVLYSERSTSPAAARIMLDETDRMVESTRALFYALVVHGKMKNEDVDTAALSYAMAVHSLVDCHIDKATAGCSDISDICTISEDMRKYIAWFSRHMEVQS